MAYALSCSLMEYSFREDPEFNPRSLSLRAGLNVTAISYRVEGHAHFLPYET
jgi:hypothetical protein